MVTLTFVFFMYVTLFAVIGAMRGWAKELLVAFSVILGIFVITVLETYIGFVRIFLEQSGVKVQFWSRTLVVVGLAFFGYQTPNIPHLAKHAAREKLQDSLLGIVLGGMNGYLVVGCVWSYLHKAGYPFEFIFPPATENTLRLISYLPPEWLGIPAIYFAVAIAFTFIVIVFI
jgi:hypothetical protein